MLPIKNLKITLACLVVQYVSLSISSNGLNYGEVALIESLKDHSVLFDVGANRGAYTIVALNLPIALDIYSFEPSPEIFQLLCYNIKNNAFKDLGWLKKQEQGALAVGISETFMLKNKKVICCNKALGTTQDAVDFYYYGEKQSNSQLSGCYYRPIVEQIVGQAATTMSVPCTTLDAFCLKNNIVQIDLLKIDTEGAELAILLGAQQLLSSGSIKQIQFEYGGTYLDAHITLKEVFDYLSSNGFKIAKMVGIHLSPIEVWNQELEDYQYSNFIATKT